MVAIVYFSVTGYASSSTGVIVGHFDSRHACQWPTCFFCFFLISAVYIFDCLVST